MQKTKIDYVDYTWNPVWGCRNACPYCYARAAAHRWGKSFEPHWMQKNFDRPMPKEPSRIFVNSMSEIAYWEREWWERVLQRIRQNPQHTFIFLTQDPEVYIHREFPPNCWIGVTVTTRGQAITRRFLATDNLTFASVEPIQEPIDPTVLAPAFDWIILGAETGNRKDRVIPPPDWIEPFFWIDTPLFMKHNLPWPWPWRKEFP